MTCGGDVSGSKTSQCYRVSPGQDQWTNATSLPRPLNWGAMVTVGDPATALYIGGWDDSLSVRTEILSLSPDSGWRRVANLRQARSYHCAVAVDQEEVLVIGK